MKPTPSSTCRCPACWPRLCGVTVEEYDSLPEGVSQPLQFTMPAQADQVARVWYDVLAPQGAQVLARYTQDYYAGKPAITINNVWQGQSALRRRVRQ